MSQAPYAVRNARFGIRLGTDLKMEDTLWAGLTDMHVKIPMGLTAENLAVKYDISRLSFKIQIEWCSFFESVCNGHVLCSSDVLKNSP